MTYEPVNSGHIEALAYEDDTMYVKFRNGSEYAYHGVDRTEYEIIRFASSVGSALAKSGFRGMKVL